MVDEATPRKLLAPAIQGTADHDDEIEGALLTGFVAIAEWMSPSGEKWLSMIHGSGAGDAALPMWQVRGYLHEALYDWPKPDGE
jgi:hypothetical protein